MQTNGGGLNIGYRGDRFVKFGKSRLKINKINYVDGLIGYRYNGYFADNVNWFSTATLHGDTNILTSINNFTNSADNYSWMWLGYFKANVTGVWTFFTSSDDASYIWIGDNAISNFTTANALVNNGGQHGVQERSGTINLVADEYYPIRIMFGEASGGDIMTVNFTPPNGTKTANGLGYYYNSGAFSIESKSKIETVKYGLQYNQSIPTEYINKRPVYAYGQSFNLLSLSPALWLDASDSSTITTVSGGVSEWRDKSGNNRHATQTNASNRPTITANNLNNNQVLDFNGSQRLIHSYAAPSLVSLIVVAKTNTTSGWRCLGVFGANLNLYINYNSSTWGHYSSGDSNLNASSYSILMIERSDSIYYRQNGSLPTSRSLTTYSNNFVIGSINSSGTESGIFNLAEVLIFERSLSTIDRELIEGYLAWKWGLVSNLPANHPYKLKNPLGGNIITNIPNWNITYQRPKVRVSYKYSMNYFDTEVDPHWSNVRLLIGGVSKSNNTQLVDESSYNHTLTLNSVEKNTNYTKFGSESSIGMNNSTIVVSSGNFSSVSVFTYELWVYHDSSIDNSYHFGFFSTNESSGRTQLYQSGGQIYTEQFNVGQVLTSPANSLPNTAGWVHIAICRNSSNLYSYYVNGILVASITHSTLMGNSSGFRVGGSNMSLNFDEVRFTMGVCRYTGSSFAVPTKRFYRG